MYIIIYYILGVCVSRNRLSYTYTLLFDQLSSAAPHARDALKRRAVIVYYMHNVYR